MSKGFWKWKILKRIKDIHHFNLETIFEQALFIVIIFKDQNSLPLPSVKTKQRDDLAEFTLETRRAEHVNLTSSVMVCCRLEGRQRQRRAKNREAMWISNPYLKTKKRCCLCTLIQKQLSLSTRKGLGEQMHSGVGFLKNKLTFPLKLLKW